MERLHLAIIPDGNRRWAKALSLLPFQGHERGMENVRSITEWCRKDPRIGTLTIWGFSTENWKRADEEVMKLMGLFESYLTRERASFMEHGIRFVHSGRRDRIPASLRAVIEDVERETDANAEFTVHLALDYGGRDEIVRAVKKMEAGEITEEGIRAHTDHPEVPDIDIIVRTSGEQRTSNFFLWQGSYAEWFFLPKHFPSLEPADLDTVVSDFAKRSRRFGGG